ncbi:tyrosine-type recombinase/integrase [Mesorhizobium sp. M0674]|uniref:tyrosine-type recombinase/integrase n=1 Tax=unclassified Mesorhizobium TaxID=325217 RepID=UPI0033351204
MRHHRKPKYVNEYLDRHGRARVYLRRPGQPQVALPTPLYSETFWTAYHAAMANEPVRVSRLKAGSVAAAVLGYYGSIEFQSLAKSTQAVYRGVLDRFVAKHGDGPIAGMKSKHINSIIDGMASTPSAAFNFRKRLSAVMDYAIGAGMRTDNPVGTSKRIKLKSSGHRTWTEDDIAAFRKHWPIGKPQRLAMEVLLHTGLRRSDAVRMGWQHATGGAFVITAQKTGAELHIPIHTELARFLQSCPKDGPAFISTSFGSARSEKAFSAYISDAAERAGLPEKSSPHGLRKAACRRLAEAGCSAMEIMSITGHTDIKEIERYCRDAAKKQLSATAMDKLQKGFDIELPNHPEGLGEMPDNQLISFSQKGDWRSRQDSNL